MPIFLVTPLAENAEVLAGAISRRINERDRYALPHAMGWFVRFDGTSVELSKDVGITGQAEGERSPIGSAVVTAVGSYYGRGPTDMWEWLKTRIEGAS